MRGSCELHSGSSCAGTSSASIGDRDVFDPCDRKVQECEDSRIPLSPLMSSSEKRGESNTKEGRTKPESPAFSHSMQWGEMCVASSDNFSMVKCKKNGDSGVVETIIVNNAEVEAVHSEDAVADDNGDGDHGGVLKGNDDDALSSASTEPLGCSYDDLSDCDDDSSDSPSAAFFRGWAVRILGLSYDDEDVKVAFSPEDSLSLWEAQSCRYLSASDDDDICSLDYSIDDGGDADDDGNYSAESDHEGEAEENSDRTAEARNSLLVVRSSVRKGGGAKYRIG